MEKSAVYRHLEGFLRILRGFERFSGIYLVFGVLWELSEIFGVGLFCSVFRLC